LILEAIEREMRKKSLNFIYIFLLILLSSSFNIRCLNNSCISSKYKNSPVLNETASFISGIDIQEKSKLFAITQTKQYKAYKKYIDMIWRKYYELKIKKINKWKVNNLPRSMDTILYPFSGPDILNALTFYPDSTEFIMMGLELPGEIPNPYSLKKNRIFYELWGVKKTLRTLLYLNFFRTSEMVEDLKNTTFSNITGIMMFFLARAGYEILDIDKVKIEGKGEISKIIETEIYKKIKKRKAIPGVRIIFRKNEHSPIKRLTFLSINLSDLSLKSSPNFIFYLNKHKNVTTFMKSASYLLSYDDFSMLRAHILKHSRNIIQDDSGIPVKYFSKNEWKLKLYGRYRVLKMFTEMYQSDLDKMISLHGKGPLPFSYGYGFSPIRSNLMIAERKTY